MPTQEGFNLYDVMLWLSGLGVTLGVFAASTAGGFIIGSIASIIRYYRIRLAAPVLFALAEVLRNSPVIVQLFLVYFGIPMFFGVRITQVEAAIYVLTANTAAFLSVALLAALESVEQEQVRTARTFALGEIDIFRTILVPQAIPVALPLVIGILVSQAQVTSLVSVIGVADLTRAGHILNQKTFEPFVVWPVIGATYFAISISIAALGRRLERTFGANSEWRGLPAGA